MAVLGLTQPPLVLSLSAFIVSESDAWAGSLRVDSRETQRESERERERDALLAAFHQLLLPFLEEGKERDELTADFK